MQIWNQYSSSSAFVPRCREISARDRERIFFLMHQMLKCGQSAEASLRAVAKAFKAEKKEDIGNALGSIAQKVSQGKPMSKSAESEYIIFTDIHRAAIMAGESSNNMAESFHILQELEEKKILSSRSGMAEIITPTILFILSVVSMFNTGLNTMPILAQMAKAQDKDLGIVPRMVMQFTNTTAEYWHFILTIVVILVITLYTMVKSTQGRFWLDTYILKVPGLGKYIQYKTYASMLLYFPHLIESGVKPKQMIPIMEALATNRVLKRRIDMFNKVLTTGGQISTAMEKAGFPSIAVTPIQISEHYAGSNKGVNDVMIEGMGHSYTILERDLNDTYTRFVAISSTIMWLLGGSVMLLEMLSIVMAQG